MHLHPETGNDLEQENQRAVRSSIPNVNPLTARVSDVMIALRSSHMVARGAAQEDRYLEEVIDRKSELGRSLR